MIDLIPKKYYEERSVKLDKLGLVIAALIIIVLISLAGVNYVRLMVKQNALAKKVQIAREQLQQVRNKTTEVLKLKQDSKKIKSQLEEKQEVMGSRVNWGLILEDLREILPETSWLVQYQINENNEFKLSGYALEQNDLEVVINRFKKSKYFSDIYVELTNQTQFSQSGYPKRVVLQYQLSGQVVVKGGE